MRLAGWREGGWQGGLQAGTAWQGEEGGGTNVHKKGVCMAE